MYGSLSDRADLCVAQLIYFLLIYFSVMAATLKMLTS